MAGLPALNDILEEYQLVDAEDRYRLLIDLGRQLEPMPDALKTDATKVRGCSASVWVYPTVSEGPAALPRRQQCRDHQGHRRADPVGGPGQAGGRGGATWTSREALAPFELRKHLSANRTQGVPNMIALVKQTAERYAAAGLGRLAVLSLLGLLEDVIGGLHLLEALGGFLVAGVGVGVRFLDQATVGGLHGREVGVAVELERIERAHLVAASAAVARTAPISTARTGGSPSRRALPRPRAARPPRDSRPAK